MGNHTLTSDTGDLMGVTGGAGPLLLAMGTFVVKDIGQSFPFVDGSNTITVSITGSVDIAAGSTITITGLTGTQTVDGTLDGDVESGGRVYEQRGDVGQERGDADADGCLGRAERWDDVHGVV